MAFSGTMSTPDLSRTSAALRFELAQRLPLAAVIVSKDQEISVQSLQDHPQLPNTCKQCCQLLVLFEGSQRDVALDSKTQRP